MTKKGEKTKAPKAKKQLNVPGTERKTNPKIDKVAAIAHEAKTAFVEASQAVQVANADLINVMKAEGVKEYVFESDDGELLSAKIKGKESVTVKKVKAAGNDEDE